MCVIMINHISSIMWLIIHYSPIILYELSLWKGSVEYVYFYIDTIFGLHGMYMVSLFVSSWVLSGSWLAGLLSASLYIFNKWVYHNCKTLCKAYRFFLHVFVLKRNHHCHKFWPHLKNSKPSVLLLVSLLYVSKTKPGYLLPCFRDETTRLWFTIPLRESFGFPFIFAQLAFITVYFKRNVSSLAQVFCSSFKFWKIVSIDVLRCFSFFLIPSQS